MFGMGFSEILMIALVAVLFLGPDKLPEAMVQVAKFFNSFRKTIHEAKSTFEEELNLKELKEEALSYKRSLEESSSDISGFKNAIPNPARELEEALNVARSGMDESRRMRLDDDWGEELEPSSKTPTPTVGSDAYKELAREAMAKAREQERKESESDGHKQSAEASDTPAPVGFKNLRSESEA